MYSYYIIRWNDSPRIKVTGKDYNNFEDAKMNRDIFIKNFKAYHNKNLEGKLEIVKIEESVID